MRGTLADARTMSSYAICPTSTSDAMSDRPLRPSFCLNIGITGHRLDRLTATAFDRGAPEIHRVLASIASIAESLRRSMPGTFADAPARLRALSGLAEGTDRRTATIARSLGYSLHAFLPFERQVYANDFSAESQVEYQALIAEAMTVFELPGERADADQAYEMVGTGIIAQCDLLIAVWDGSRARGPGGTAEVIRRALRRGLPVVRFDPAHWKAPVLLWASLDPIAIEHENLADYKVFPATDDLLRLVLRQLLLPPALPEEHSHLVQFLKEREHSHGGRKEYRALLWALRVQARQPGRTRADIADQSADEEWKLFARLAGPLAPSASLAESRLRETYRWPDRLAAHFAQVFRSGHVLNFCLAAIAVLLALAGLLFPVAKAIFVVLEIIVIVSLLVHTRVGRAQQWHRRWLDYRYLAERLRPMRTLKLFGVACSGAPWATQRLESYRWTDWYSQAVWREMGPPAGRVDPRYINNLRACVLSAEICPQVRYHWANALEMDGLEKRLHRLSDAFSAATLFAGAVYLLLFAIGYQRIHEFGALFTAITAAFPAVGGALYGIRVQGDFSGTARRSLRMADELLLIASAVEDAYTFSQLSEVAERAAGAMLTELGEWQLAFRQRNLEVPG